MTAMITKYIKNAFKKRTVGFYFTLGAAIIALVGAILYVICDASDISYSSLGFTMMLVGAITVLFTVFTDFSFAPVIPSIFYSAGFALTLDGALPSLSDVWNGVNFIGGNGILATIFAGVFLIADLFAIVGCFMNQRKKESFIPNDDTDMQAIVQDI